MPDHRDKPVARPPDIRQVRLMKALIALTVFALSLVTAPAQKKEVEYVKLAKVEVAGEPAAGARVTATLHFKIEPGFHTQSHKPSEDYFIPTVLKLDPIAGIRAGTIKYPDGKEEAVDGLDKPLSVFDKEFAITVPLAISAQAKLPATLTGTLTYQACKGAVCYPPKKLKVEVKLEK
jgi:DsbC/DsbD-like thiol-disulfide interchange protein